MNWPLVDKNDNGIRPAGKSDQCFYCSRNVGEEHKRDCVIVKKRVKVSYLFEIEIDVPHSWTREDINFHRNESSWCANNALDDIKQYAGENCLCEIFDCEFIEVTDDTPMRDQK